MLACVLLRTASLVVSWSMANYSQFHSNVRCRWETKKAVISFQMCSMTKGLKDRWEEALFYWERHSGDFLEWRYPAPAYAGVHNHTWLTHPPSSSPFTLRGMLLCTNQSHSQKEAFVQEKKRNPLFFGESSVRAFTEQWHRVFKVYVK